MEGAHLLEVKQPRPPPSQRRLHGAGELNRPERHHKHEPPGTSADIRRRIRAEEERGGSRSLSRVVLRATCQPSKLSASLKKTFSTEGIKTDGCPVNNREEADITDLLTALRR